MKRSPRKTAAQWAELVSEYQLGKESEREFCDRHGFKLVTLRKWRYHFASEKAPRAAQSQSSFIKAKLSAPGTLKETAVLCIGQDIRLECPGSFDVSALAELALAVHHGR